MAARTAKKKSIRTTVSLPAEDYDELERIAEKKKVSVAWVVREAVDRYLDLESPLFRREREAT
ncbi:MAG: ribbon-helix-helix protein, CopG family [Caldilineaceae bacterium]|nr:ribbon-helix-helix protein, CopG family [Caldilineaceae bacterium]